MPVRPAGPGALGDGTAAFAGHLVPSAYLRFVVALWALDACLLAGIGWLLGGLAGLRSLLPATLAAIAGGTVALASTDLTIAAIAAGAAGLAALAVLLVDDGGVAAGARELRVSLAGSAVLIVVIAAAPAAAAVLLGGAGLGEAPAGQPDGEAGAVVGLLALAVALAVGLRLGVIPFHLRVPRLADVVPPITLPLLLVWIPVPLVIAALAVSDQLLAPLALSLEGERWLIVAAALVTLVAAALAAFIQDDLRHATGYLVIADAGLLLLGFAALDPAVWGPARVWLVAMAASKTTVAAWSAVTEDRFGTRSIPDLRGWLRHSPMLGAGFVVAAVATFGLPGWAAFDARLDLAGIAAGSPLDSVLVIAGLATLPAYVRLIALGTGPATSRVRGAAPERFVRGRRLGRPGVARAGAARCGRADDGAPACSRGDDGARPDRRRRRRGARRRGPSGPAPRPSAGGWRPRSGATGPSCSPRPSSRSRSSRR